MKCNTGLFAPRDPRLHRDKIQLIDRLSFLLVAIHLIRSRDVCVTFEVTRVRCSLVLSLSFFSRSSHPPSRLTYVRSPYPTQEKKMFSNQLDYCLDFSRASLSTLSIATRRDLLR